MKYLLFSTFLVFQFPILAQHSTPNILIIIADDLGIDYLDVYSDNGSLPSTPNISALSQDGLSFDNTWSTPQCTPTRAAIISGKYGIKTGVMRPPGNLDLEHTSIFNAVPDHYSTALIGKWHIASPQEIGHPADHGLDHFEGILNGSVDDYYVWDKISISGTTTRIEEYATTHLTHRAIDWINQQSQPWLLFLSHIAPHSPFHVPPDSLHQRTNLTGQQNRYLAAIEAMDHEIGRLLSSLSQETLENTLVVFIGDNGTPNSVQQGYPSGHGKGSLYQGGINVPFIVAGKGIERPGERESFLSNTTDLYATILEITGKQLQGGMHNSLSLKPLFSCAPMSSRPFLYTDYENGNTLEWTIRNEQYKLIETEEGNTEFYDLASDPTEEMDLFTMLTPNQVEVLSILKTEADIIRTGWSCTDGIRNGTETSIDDCLSTCGELDVLSTEGIGCCASPSAPSVFYELPDGDQRMIYTNDYPNHDFCFNPNLIPEETYYLFDISLNPSIADQPTKLVRENGRPARYFGISTNGVIFAPAPAQPFIFENPNTGEFNWEWVFEPTTNQGDGRDLVALDCASGHTGPQGYHYHGNMVEYVETIMSGISSGMNVPDQPMHIGWASDGYPILYRFGPDQDGNLKEMLPSFQLRAGLRPGDGITAPCGPYSGKYTRDFEYICGKGDLDECNGLQSSVDIQTARGIETFDYYYVITKKFPQIARCIIGTPSSSFDNGADKLSGSDKDGDGYIAQYDCDDNNAEIHPNAVEIPGNDVDENCDNLLTSDKNIAKEKIIIYPNPNNGHFKIDLQSKSTMYIYSKEGKLISIQSNDRIIEINSLKPGIYFVQIRRGTKSISLQKVMVL